MNAQKNISLCDILELLPNNKDVSFLLKDEIKFGEALHLRKTLNEEILNRKVVRLDAHRSCVEITLEEQYGLLV